jgi:TRAP transporter 4TM/12TM fusion protein
MTAIADTPAPPARDPAVLVLSLAMVGASLAWGLGLPLMAGLALFEEQPMAAVLGLAMMLVAGTLAAGRGVPLRLLAWALGAAMLALTLVLAWRYPQLMILSALRPAWLVATCGALLAGLAFLIWRTVGAPIVVIVAAFSVLAVTGGAFGVPATPPARWAVYVVTDPNALIGLPLRVAVQIVIPFILLGALLQHSGGSAFFTQLCIAAFGRFRGGQAKAAVGASALFGTVSGNAVSNVAGTGIVTIPLMKRAGLSPHVAGAVESAASTGGQLLPPVMGAAAFVMADTLQVPYMHVVSAALLPALLYYAAIFVQIDRYSARRGIAPVPRGEGPSAAATFWAGWHFVLPFAVLFVLLFRYQTRPDFAALGAIVALVVTAAVRPWQGRRLGLAALLAAIEETGRSAAPLILVTAAAGLVIGLVSLTGLGFSIAMQAVAAAGGNAVLLLAMVAAIAIVFGMGMPTVAVYVVLATVLAPALTDAGLQPMQAHLFILYFGLLSMLTPPVALASITAARIAGTGMWRTSFAAMRLAWVAYFIPFLFAFSPELLLIGSPWAAGIAAVTAFAGTSAISIAAVGYARGPIGPGWRLGFVLAGIALLLPPVWGPLVAAGNLAGALALVALYMASGRSRRAHTH